MVPFERLGVISYSPSIVTMALSCISSEIKLDTGRKSWFFHTPFHSAPLLGGSPSAYWHPIWYGKTRMVGIPDGIKTFEDMYNRLHTIPACDGRMDGQTSSNSIVCAMHTRRTVINDTAYHIGLHQCCFLSIRFLIITQKRISCE